MGERLSGSVLMTLTGPGGIGKTRLALAVAAELPAEAADEVRLVELASLHDPALVAGEVAACLGVRGQLGRKVQDVLVDALQHRSILLVLDSCEHLIEACSDFAAHVLRRCPQVRVLATSREPLGVAGECCWRVAALHAPDPDGSVAEIERTDAVRLFVDRGRAASQTFELSPSNARAIAEICRGLDGIPLAIELAAARVGIIGVDVVVGQVRHAPQNLRSITRSRPPRHETLQATVDWSHRLLSTHVSADLKVGHVSG